MTLHEALVVVKGQTIPALRGSGGDGHAEALALVVAGLETLETSEALYQQEKLEHKQTRRDLDAKDHEVARLKADLAHERGTLNEVAKAARYFEAPAGRLPPLAEHVAGLVAEVERLRAELKRALASMDRCDLAQHRHHEQLLNETRKAKAEVERLRERNTRQASILEECPSCTLKAMLADDEWPLVKLRAEVERLRAELASERDVLKHCADVAEQAEARLREVRNILLEIKTPGPVDWRGIATTALVAAKPEDPKCEACGAVLHPSCQSLCVPCQTRAAQPEEKL